MPRFVARSLVLVAVLAGGLVLLAQPPGPPRGGGGPGRGGVAIKPGEDCPAGTTLVRPGRCQAPELPAPSILDYRPESTVVNDAHLVPKAKFPVVDIHSHQPATEENMARLIGEMDALNLRVLVNLSGGSGGSLAAAVDRIEASPHKDRFRVFANVDWNGAGGPGWAEKAVAGLEQAVRDGAIGLKVYKGLGLRDRKADGSRLTVDDPRSTRSGRPAPG
jgi:hypothetical protein